MTVKKPIDSKIDEESPEDSGQYASPPCYQHELDPLYQDIPDDTDLPADKD